MPEEINSTETGEESQEETETQTGETGDQNTDDNKEGDDGNAAEEDENKSLEQKPSGEDDELEIGTRKSPKDYIIERKERKIKKLEAQSKNDNDEEDESEEDDVLPEDEKIIEKVVEKKLTPIFQRQLAAEDEQEVQNFVNTNPEFKSYEVKVRKLMAHPSRAQVPISSLFYEAAGPHLMKLGAQKAKEADNEANQSNAGGGSSRDTGDKKVDWNAMPNEEFGKKLQEIKTAPRKD
ncbi:MAG: hypothetical protein ABIC19_00655 [Patescibacteria group bacterium]